MVRRRGREKERGRGRGGRGGREREREKERKKERKSVIRRREVLCCGHPSILFPLIIQRICDKIANFFWKIIMSKVLMST